jgi:hypothetical protein
MSGSIMPLVKEYGLMLHPVRGFDSTANVHLIAKRLVERRRAGKQVHILYLGDFDASGRNMDDDIKARLEESRQTQHSARSSLNALPSSRATSTDTICRRRR